MVMIWFYIQDCIHEVPFILPENFERNSHKLYIFRGSRVCSCYVSRRRLAPSTTLTAETH